MNTGILIKCIGGFYYVKAADVVYECKARGVFRKQAVSPFAGDQVEFELDGSQKGWIVKILPRKNSFLRPPLANLDQIVFVASTCDPSPNLLVLDKLIAIAEKKGIEPVLAVTKTDLADCTEMKRIYESSGFQVVLIDNKNPSERQLETLKTLLAGKISAFVGNSGVGKSSLLNRLLPTLHLETSDISQKLGRGRHTTRQVELFELPQGGFAADTPGFSTVDFERYETILKEDLPSCFREFAPYLDECRFTGCSHTVEKGCAVLEALKEGKIMPSRHESYRQLYDSVKDIKEWQLQKREKNT